MIKKIEYIEMSEIQKQFPFEIWDYFPEHENDNLNFIDGETVAKWLRLEIEDQDEDSIPYEKLLLFLEDLKNKSIFIGL